MSERPGESAGPDTPRRSGHAPAERVWIMDRAGLGEVDRLATQEFGIPSFALMENAASGLASETLAMLSDLGRREVVIFSGPGNNGGDGLSAARHLSNADAQVEIVMVGPVPTSGNAALNLSICRAMGLSIHEFEPWSGGDTPAVVIDALLGTGLARPIEGELREAVEEIHRLRSDGARIIAADLPSGLDADTGLVVGGSFGVCVHADLTVTFGAIKKGFGRLDAQDLLGEVVVCQIGCPAELLDRFGERIEHPPGHDSPTPRSDSQSARGTGAGRAAGDCEDESPKED